MLEHEIMRALVQSNSASPHPSVCIEGRHAARHWMQQCVHAYGGKSSEGKFQEFNKTLHLHHENESQFGVYEIIGVAFRERLENCRLES